MNSYNSKLILFIIIFFKGGSTLISTKQSLFEEFSSHEEINISFYDGMNNKINSTFDAKTGAPLHNIQVQFNYFDAPIILDLKINRAFISSKYIEKVSHSIQRPNIINSFCFYIGHVVQAGNKFYTNETSVAASTCSGLRAYIAMPEEILHIEPQSSDLNGKHVFFKESDAVKKFNTTCVGKTGLSNLYGHRRKLRKKRRLEWPYDANNETLIVELYIVNDHSQFVSQGGKAETVIQRTKDIVNIVNSLYRPLNIYIALVGVEVWSDVDRIEMAETSDRTMNNFLEYRRQYINSAHPNDNAQMISSRSFGEGIVGKAPIMTICSWQYSGGINLDHSHLIGRIATTLAHEIGHNFGMTHDTEASRCLDEKCIMSPSSGGLTNPTKWSESSKEQLSDALHQGMHHCLHNVPSKLFGDQPVCGDGFIDKGEQCDCGLPQDCTSLCCNASTCILHPHARCSSGNCCDLNTCQMKPATHECRPAHNDCDLGEYCDGNSEFCPFDVFKHDGFQCSVLQTESYCYLGQCRTHDTQCKLLWGNSGKSSHELCYTYYNVLGNPKGNCGLNWADGKTFTKCESEDVACGMLHCQHTSEKLMFWKESLAYDLPDSYIRINNTRYDCKAAILDVGLDSDNPGLVADGSKCGDNKICMSQKCVGIENFKERLKCPDCHGNGVCNSLSQCHCNPGWAPPYCDLLGNGGSLHSGQIEIRKYNARLTLGMCLFFFIIFPSCLICIICLYRRRVHILKKIGLGKYNSVHSPVRPPRPIPGDLSAGKSSLSSRKPLPPPYKPPSPPRRVVSFSDHNTENKYQLPPPRLPPKSYITSSPSFKLNDTRNSVSLKEALTELQQIDFLKDTISDDPVDLHSSNCLENVHPSENEAPVEETRRLVPFRKAPPPPPPTDSGQNVRRSTSLKPPVRPPPPPRPYQV